MNDLPFGGVLPPVHSAELPRAADVVVIGGGIAGISTAWELAGKGLKVALCEKGRVGAEQSMRNWGWIRVQGRDPAEIPLGLEARRLWQRCSKRPGPELGYRQIGVTYLARAEKELADFGAFMVHARADELDTRLLTRAVTAQRMTGAASGHGVGRLHTASDARAEPWVAVPMIAEAMAQGRVGDPRAMRWY